MAIKITVQRRGPFASIGAEWQASFNADPGVWELGPTVNDALGNLIRKNQELSNVVVEVNYGNTKKH